VPTISGIGRESPGDRSENIWLPEHIAAFLAVCSPDLRLPLSLALDTGQRQGDLLMLAWSATTASGFV
jgi:hypothetical protein